MLAVPSYTAAMSDTLYTIGYQGAELEQVIASLSAAKVSVVVDTRETPTSRRVEFRGRALATALEEAEIRYVSIPALGVPRQLRQLAAQDWAAFATAYRKRLASVRKELGQLVQLVVTERVCLLCYEADPACCHRSILAREIQTLLETPAVHLRPDRPDLDDDRMRLRIIRQIVDREIEVVLG
jgi:uncharacterized protein (DUF488 family)